MTEIRGSRVRVFDRRTVVRRVVAKGRRRRVGVEKRMVMVMVEIVVVVLVVVSRWGALVRSADVFVVGPT